MQKTIAQLAILSWIENKLGICDMNIKFTDKREAFVTDSNGDTMTVKYDSDTEKCTQYKKAPAVREHHRSSNQ